MGSLERSGMESMLLTSYPEWVRLGYKCDVVATAATIGSIAPQMRERGYGVFHIPLRSKWRYLPRLQFVREFYSLCRSGYDVVHLHTEAGRPLFAIMAKIAGVRQIAVTPHGTFKFRGTLRARKFMERHLIRLLGGRFGMISEGVRECEWNQFRIKGNRIWNWLDTSYFRPPSPEERAHARRNLGISDNEFVIVSVGNCSSIKNHDALLRAITLLPEPIHPIYLHVGHEELHHPERKLAADLNIRDQVRFLDTQSDPRPFLWAADVFAMPSKSEGLSIAALEAIASSTPALFSNVPGLVEIANETRWTQLSSTAPDSIAEGIALLAKTELSERLNRALADSDIIRDRFSLQNGLHSIIVGLYAHNMETVQPLEQVQNSSRQPIVTSDRC
jgi:glycosyltransferase involved in cell wall biosynthesis